jgi:transposase
LTTAELEELRRLRRENAELRRVNEILKAAS